ncbi:hypothetical protein GCM10010393_18890 [Streptomyces gobitricini]|uniref:Uncharacterized protein n=1 Tax=Streptomyces gobitricini TaxID=68211 RepID=A0ABP5YZI0_9ACTN
MRRRVGGDDGDVGRRPGIQGKSLDRAEGQVREVDLLALVAQRKGQREPRVDVEAAPGARDEDAFPGFEESGVCTAADSPFGCGCGCGCGCG